LYVAENGIIAVKTAAGLYGLGSELIEIQRLPVGALSGELNIDFE
jgi:hypothetical protein